jgi:hypothetical protein
VIPLGMLAMEKLFYLSMIVNWLTAVYLLFKGLKLLASQYNPDSNVMLLLYIGLVLIAFSLVSFMLYDNGFPEAATLMGWVSWMVMVITSG